MQSPLVKALQSFKDPQSESQLRALDLAVQAIDCASCTQAEFHALLSIFERFPEQDGYGVFWGIIHALEACDGYESELLASVQRKPCEFNVRMVNRLLNAEVVEVAGRSLEEVLQSVLENNEATPQVIHDAKTFLARRTTDEA